MNMLALIFWLLFSLALLFVTAVRPLRTKHSMFELKRRGDTAVIGRERLLGDVYALRRAIAVILVVLLTVIAWAQWQEMGVIEMLLMLVLVILLSRWAPVERVAMNFYHAREKALLGFVAKWPSLGWLLGSDRRANHDQRLESREHLVHLVESAGHILTAKQQDLIKRSLHWHAATVREVMTPADDIVTVSKSDLLGPLVLNDLHKSGYHSFPVVRGDIHNVLGMVNISDLLHVDAVQKSLTAEKAMTPVEVRLSVDTELPAALEKLMAHPGQFGLVVDEDKTLGLISLRDVLGALLK